MSGKLIESLHTLLDRSRSDSGREVEIRSCFDRDTEPHRDISTVGDRTSKTDHSDRSRFRLAWQSDIFEFTLHEAAPADDNLIRR